jgi:hypothetical protein
MLSGINTAYNISELRFEVYFYTGVFFGTIISVRVLNRWKWILSKKKTNGNY